MNRKKPSCRKLSCTNDPYRAGLCKQHYEEAELRRQQRDSAVTALHFGIIDGKLPDDEALREELQLIRSRWNRVCNVANSGCGTTNMPVEEAEFAVEWCIALAQEIVEAQRAIAAGKPVAYSLAQTKESVWERFRNLDAGLRSNGTPRG